MSQNNKTWEINGVSLYIDLSDADVAERYENAFDELDKEVTTLPYDGKGSEWIRAYCKLYRNLYDRIFGEGTAERIFAGQPTSSEVYEGVYESFLTFVSAQGAGIAERRAELISKFTPNRAQRRAAPKRPAAKRRK